jgi:glycosyltransferase involved in cell wall biosynthesis
MISVIMPVYLEPYEAGEIKSATNPEVKFMRAVQSFLDQSFTNAELCIVADGCKKAEAIYKYNYSNDAFIKFRMIERNGFLNGRVRQTGIEMAEGEIICYLDHDDFFGKNHLKIINDNFIGDWCYFNDYLIKGKEGDNLVFNEREARPELFYIGTSMIAHKKSIGVVWPDGYTHDWRMIESCLLPHPGVKIPTPEYYVCHFHPKDF